MQLSVFQLILVKQSLHLSCHKQTNGNKGTINVVSILIVYVIRSCNPAYYCIMFYNLINVTT